ncbi:MAG: ECF transporter S component [Oscillospiraceae bacterium]|nr:ECF transporter S component [Oscillospiraceae bacterium]
MVKRSYAPIFDARTIAQYAIFIAIILVMRITHLTSIPVGPLVMTLAMIPIAIGAMLLGPLGGAILGTVYGFTSLYDAMTGASLMTGVFFQLSPILTIILCVVIRGFVGAATGWLFQLFKKLDPHRIWCYFAGGLAAPMLNTILFMGYIVLVFYQTEYIQGKVVEKGAANPLMFIILMVGVQGLVEWISGCIVAGGVTKAVAHALKRD